MLDLTCCYSSTLEGERRGGVTPLTLFNHLCCPAENAPALSPVEGAGSQFWLLDFKVALKVDRVVTPLAFPFLLRSPSLSDSPLPGFWTECSYYTSVIDLQPHCHVSFGFCCALIICCRLSPPPPTSAMMGQETAVGAASQERLQFISMKLLQSM